MGTRVLVGLLFDVRPTDALTYVTTAALVAIVAVAACAVPVRRATRVDPATLLR
jgi:ABC-type antimicrobial peptide transport system permease subunit